MVDQSRLWTASVDRHVQRIEHELSPQVVRHGPADDLPGVGVEHEGEVEPSLPGTDVGDVRDRRVVRAFLLRPPHPNSPVSRISLATRFLAHLTPSVLSSKWILGAP